MSWLLDTNVVSELVKPSPSPAVVAWLEAQPEETLSLSVVTFAELRRGVAMLAAGKKRDALRAWVDGALAERFAARVLTVDLPVCEAWGELLARARRSGANVGVMDGFIAATAVVHRLTVVTRNTRDFAALEAVETFDPFEAR